VWATRFTNALWGCRKTTITINDFIRDTANDELILLECGDVCVFDRTSQTLYSALDTHDRAVMNPMVDLRTHLGHSLLWAKQCELDCTTSELAGVFGNSALTPLIDNGQWRVWEVQK
jgi:hypothetical protein